MNTKNNEGPQQWIDPALEARIVAGVLGETSAFEAAELDRVLAETPELAIFKRRIEAVHALVGAAVRPEAPKIQLSPDRRQMLLEKLGARPRAPKKKVFILPRPFWWSSRNLIAVAASLIIGAIVVTFFGTMVVFQARQEPPDFQGAAGGYTEYGTVPAAAHLAMNAAPAFGVAVNVPPPPSAPMPPTSDYRGGTTVGSLTAGASSSVAMLNAPAGMIAGSGIVASAAAPAPAPAIRREVALLQQKPGRSEELAESEQKLKSAAEPSSLGVADSQDARNKNAIPGKSGFVSSIKRGEGNEETAPAAAGKTISANAIDALLFPESSVAVAASEKPAAEREKQWPSIQQGSNSQKVDEYSEVRQSGKQFKTAVTDTSGMKEDLAAKPARAPLPAGTEALRDSSGKYLGYVQYGAPISANADVATATGVVSQPVFTAAPSIPESSTVSTAPQVGDQLTMAHASAIKTFTGTWAKGVGSGSGAGAGGTGDRKQAAQDNFKDTGAVDSSTKQSGPSSGTDWDSAYMFRGVNVFASGANGTASNSRSGSDASGPNAAPAPMELAKAKSSDAENKERALNGSKGMDLMSNLEVTTKSGQRATTEIVRDFEYPVRDEADKPNGQTLAGANTYSGSTVVSGGELSTDRAAKMDKKVSDEKSASAPVLGDVPLAGRAFSSNLEKDSTPASQSETQAIKQPLQEAQDFYSSGRYDLALKRYEQVLSADPNNIAARKGMEEVNNAKVKYYETAYNEARGDKVRQVNNAWSMPVRKFAPAANQMQPQIDTSGTTGISRKLDAIIIPKIDFRDATVREALEFIKQRAASLDTAEQDSTRKGVNIVFKSLADSAESESKITLSLTDIPLRAAIDYVARAANLKWKVERHAVSVVPQVDTTNESPAKVPQPSTKAPPAFQTEIKTVKQPFSTFSLHVSDVSFQLAKDALARGTMPDPERIRAEEFYNAFDYNDPSPAPGEEVACRIEQCAHPFLQQRDLVRIALKVAAAGRAAGQPLRLTILLDTSGSMEREDRAASVRRALGTLASLLGPNDRVTLIGFARTPRLLAEQVPGDQANKLVEIAARTPSEGGTNLELALGLASELALKQKLPAAQNRIVLLTDGAANLGDANPARLARQIEKTRQQGISFDACGVGANGLNDEILEALTRKGDGRYYFINKPEDADAGFARQLAGALRPAAENVKVQVVFNPARVSQYRLIGFEKHLLKKEDFRNDKVQAAELSAEEAGVAVYQVQTLPEGDGELGEVFVRFRDPANGQMVEHSWTIPYDAKAPGFDKVAPSMQLAATAALLAEKLRGDPQVDLNALAPVITNLRGQYPHQAKVADLIRMFEQMRK